MNNEIKIQALNKSDNVRARNNMIGQRINVARQIVLIWSKQSKYKVKQKRFKNMKFQFCGNINCPQWFIAQISVLTKITAVKMKLIFSQIILHYLQNTEITPKVSKLLNGTGLDYYEIHSVMATLQFILQNSITFNVNDLTLNKQLIDLGLPKENVQSITKTFKSSRDKLIEKSLQNVLKTVILSSLALSFIEDWYLDHNKGNLKSLNIKKPVFAQISLKYKDCIQGETSQNHFIATADQLDYLIYELQSGLQTIERLEKAQSMRNQDEQLQ